MERTALHGFVNLGCPWESMILVLYEHVQIYRVRLAVARTPAPSAPRPQTPTSPMTPATCTHMTGS